MLSCQPVTVFLAGPGIGHHLCSRCSARLPPGFHPEMVFFANLGVNLHVCLCGDLQVASVQPLDFIDIGQTGTRRVAVGLSGEAVKKNPHFLIGN